MKNCRRRPWQHRWKKKDRANAEKTHPGPIVRSEGKSAKHFVGSPEQLPKNLPCKGSVQWPGGGMPRMPSQRYKYKPRGVKTFCFEKTFMCPRYAHSLCQPPSSPPNHHLEAVSGWRCKMCASTCMSFCAQVRGWMQVAVYCDTRADAHCCSLFTRG